MAEILATLDVGYSLDALPFMQDMVQYCGLRLTVLSRAEKVCDTIEPKFSCKMSNTVLLDDLRSDGSAHEGCQAECRLLWK